MAKKELGRAQYKVFRNGSVIKIVANGTVSGMNVKLDIEQLPFLIYPPMFGLYVIVPDIVLPALRPFVYEEEFLFPKSANVVTVIDADGKHGISIEEPSIAIAQPTFPDPNETGYCVFSWVGTDTLKIAKCDAVLPAVYLHVFGPAAYGECDKYVKDNGGQ